MGRFPLKGNVEIACGGGRSGGRSVDISDNGALIECSLPLEPGARIIFHCIPLKLIGSAYVRHCSQIRENVYRVGIKFHGSLARTMPGMKYSVVIDEEPLTLPVAA
jgi:hypothetical protein